MTSVEHQCIFCKIVRGEIPAKKIYEDSTLLAFHDIRPAAPVHFLVIPKQHIVSLADTSEAHIDLLGRMLQLSPSLAQQMGADRGFKVQINTGEGGGQEVFHLHLHILAGKKT